MKKSVCILICIITLFICSNVYAEENNSDLLAECHYVSKTNSGSDLEIMIGVRKDYQLKISIGNYGSSQPSQYVTYTLVNKDISYEKFIDENGIATCSNVNKIYQYITSISDGATRRTGITHYIQTNPIDPKPAGLSTGDYTYSYDQAGSKFYVTENYDEGVIEEEGWLKICHYGSYYLKFNKDTYDTNIPPLVEHFGIDPDAIDVMTYLRDNDFSCPTSLCSQTEGARGYTYTRYTFKMEYDAKCLISQDFVSEYRCGSLESHMKEYDNLKNNGDRVLLNEKIEKIRKFCDSVYQNRDYDDATNCVKECFLIDNIFSKDMNIGANGECDFSQRLLAWASNILRWIKYILPVIVIVLGILDFIKAIGADKDDEMKKAQKRFITRLIAAALVFIIPLIIEFVLNKMGFGYDSCGLF